MQIARVLSTLLIAAGLVFGVPAKAKVVEDVPGSLKTLTSIGDALDSPDHHPVHILYVHGINEVGAGDSETLRKSICTRLNLCNFKDWTNAGAEYAEKGIFADGSYPPLLDYLGSPVWANKDEWHSAAPFVAHWVVHLRGHSSILVLDEINWWPLVLSLKCRHMVIGEVNLAGPDDSLLDVCSQQSKQDPGGEGRFFPWISSSQAADLKQEPARAVRINRAIKDRLLDWGFSDAMLAVGGLNAILREGLRQLILRSAEFDPNGTGTTAPGDRKRQAYDWQGQFRSGRTIDREYIGVTHSLGSYLLFSTLNLEPDTPPAPESGDATSRSAHANENDKTVENNAVDYVFTRTSLIYFFANQVSLLELTDLEGAMSQAVAANPAAGASTPPAGTPAFPHFSQLMSKWAHDQAQFQRGVHPNDEAARKKIQVVAWSDPGDLLTWKVPNIGTVNVVNLYVQNAPHLFWVFESPTGAHDNYAQNKQVLRVMFSNTPRPHNQ